MISHEAVPGFQRTTLGLRFLKNSKELSGPRQDDQCITRPTVVAWHEVCPLFFLLLLRRTKGRWPPCGMSCCPSPTGAALLGPQCEETK